MPQRGRWPVLRILDNPLTILTNIGIRVCERVRTGYARGARRVAPRDTWWYTADRGGASGRGSGPGPGNFERGSPMGAAATTRAARWTRALLAWFGENRRPMPWRDAPTPYAVWISEIMLQQTQVGAVLPKFDRFIQRFPDVETLAAADVQEVLKAWEGMGYYARARNLHRAARIVVADHGGRLPGTADGLRALPGIGPYASAAISSIAHGEPSPAVDGNVLRVIARFRGIADDIRRPATRDRIAAYLLPHIRRVDPSAFNQALMELGALVCRPRNPRCGECPMARDCVALRTGRVDALPVKARLAAPPHVVEVSAVVWRGMDVLVCRRPEAGMLGGLWEFPGGRCAEAEAPEQALARVLRDRVDARVSAGNVLAVVGHAYSHFHTTVHAFTCRVEGAHRAARAGADQRWVSVADLDALPMTKVARMIAGHARSVAPTCPPAERSGRTRNGRGGHR